MALLGNPSARFPNECRLRTVITTIKLPTDDRARPSIACVRAQAAAAAAAAAGLAQCDATDGCAALADAPEALPPSRSVCVCVAPQGPARQPSIALCLSSSLPLCLLFSPLPFLSKPSPSSHTHTQTPHISQCLPAAHARERTRRRSSSSCPRTATPRARRSKSCLFFLPYSFLRAQTAQTRAHATTRRLLARDWTLPVAFAIPMATPPAHSSHNDH